MPGGNVLLADRAWQDVPGCTGTRIYPFLRKIDTVSSNSYVVATDAAILLIDPGGLPDQMEHLVSVIKKERVEKPRPVLTFFTHIHLDHWRQAGVFPGFKSDPGVIFAVQEKGAQALASGDTRLTAAAIFGETIEAFPAGFALFPEQERGCEPGELIHREGFPFPYEYIFVNAPGNREIRCERIHLGNLPVDIFHTPGHSPDSICIRIGGILFIGDMIFAASPGIAGLAGWNQQDLINSVDDVSALLAFGTLSACCPGHGRPIPGPVLVTTLDALRREATSLDAIEELNAARVREVSVYAELLMEAVEDIFTIIAGRLAYVAHMLDELEASGEAESVGSLIGSDAVDDLLGEFNQFLDEYRSRGKPDVHIMLKAGQIIMKLDRAFNRENLGWIIDEHLLRRAERLLSDYMRMFKGYRQPCIAESCDIRALVRETIDYITREPTSDEKLLAAADDEATYLRLLAARIAHVKITEEVPLRFDDSAGPLVASVDPARLTDLVIALVEEFIGIDAREILFDVRPAGEQVILSITGFMKGSGEKSVPGKRLRFLEEECALAGGVLRTAVRNQDITFSCEMGTGSILSALQI